MAESKPAKKPAEAAASAKKPAEAAASSESKASTPQQEARKEKQKSRWDEAACQKAARRYTTREAWAKNAPSSYKAASARGWAERCCAHMTAPKVTAKPRARKTA